MDKTMTKGSPFFNGWLSAYKGHTEITTLGKINVRN